MAWVVDTNVLIDVLEDDPSFGQASARHLDHHLEEGLLLCPITYAELSPAFDGDQELQNEFLTGVGIAYRVDWIWHDTLRAHAAWHAHVRRRRRGRGEGPKRPITDILIGSFAQRFQGLLTRNAEHFRAAFPSLELRTP